MDKNEIQAAVQEWVATIPEGRRKTILNIMGSYQHVPDDLRPGLMKGNGHPLPEQIVKAESASFGRFWDDAMAALNPLNSLFANSGSSSSSSAAQ